MFWRVLGLLKPYRGSIFTGLLCLLLSTPLSLFHPLVWMYVVNEVIQHERHEMLLPALGVMLAVHLASMGLTALRSYVLGVAGQRFVEDLRNRIHAKLLRQSVTYFQERRTGDLMQRAIADVETLQDIVINGVDNILGNVLSFLWVAGIIIAIHPVVGLLTMLPLGLVAIMVWVFNKKIKGLYKQIRDRLGDLSSHLQEHLQGIVVIKAFAREDLEAQRFRTQNDAYTRESLKGVVARTAYGPGVMTVGFLSNMMLLGSGAYYVIYGGLGIGALVAFRGYWWQLYSPVSTLAQINETMQRAMAAAARVFDVLDAPQEFTDAPNALALPGLEGRVRFEKVSFGYRPERKILNAVELEALPGQQVGIVGPSGAGKSTALSLLLRFYDPQAGRILLDGHDLRELQQSSYRNQFALVTQEPFLFNLTVRENILFGRPAAKPDEIEQAARSANAHEFIKDLPEGYETVTGERGVKLSGGQKQRLCIARAFLANPKVLLLDEATASVEPESEALIQAALERLMQGRTTFIVTHRLSLVRGCAQILVVSNGQILERGTHDELLAARGWYARMYNLQMEGGVQ